MKNSRRSSLNVDDYLDLLNLAAHLGDVKWQKEIMRKLHYMQPCLAEKQKA